ncbi:MAG: hypothetical protein MJ180_04315 [Candidatus Gastranaerophilales bacterium]|nr:hypothetical protein [Candidatus Gastranaerophilales bacterium]
MKEEYKKLLKIGLIILAFWFVVNLLLLGQDISTAGFSSDYIWFLLCLIPFPIYLLIIFSPAIVILYFLFKKFANTKIRILLVAFLIPLLNMIYYFLEHFLFHETTGDFISMAIGFTTLFGVLPISFIITAFIPSKLLPVKKEILITEVLMGVTGLIMMIFSIHTVGYIERQLDKKALNQYEPTINKIEKYKAENNIYPNKINVTEDIKRLPIYEYKTYNNRKDYKFTVYYETNKIFNRCSSKELEDCSIKSSRWYYYKKVGNWIERIEDYD